MLYNIAYITINFVYTATIKLYKRRFWGRRGDILGKGLGDYRGKQPI
jgi:hypothetical protein